MAEKPILFSGEMVKAILDGRKTMTRRVIKPQPNIPDANWKFPAWADVPLSPYGRPGDCLWVRETHWIDWYDDGVFDAKGRPGVVHYRACHPYPEIAKSIDGQWRPSIHMPRWASRIMLRVTAVRVERLQDITLADAIMEGCPDSHLDGLSPLDWFEELWNEINGKRGYFWSDEDLPENLQTGHGRALYGNPWVWVVEFEVSK